MRLKNGIVYTAGESNYNNTTANLYQPVYWENTNVTELDPPEESESYRSSGLEIDSSGVIHLINVDKATDADHAYWVEGTGYIYPATSGITSNTPWDNYLTTAIDEINGTIYQAGVGMTPSLPESFFLAENTTEIIHNTTFDPDPMNPESGFTPRGLYVAPATIPADTEVYIYGSYDDFGNEPAAAGYTVNGADSAWTTLPPMHTRENDEDIRYMLDKDNYIHQIVLAEEDDIYTVYIYNEDYELEIPYEGNPDVQIHEPQYTYLEIIDDSVFVGGSYIYVNTSLELSYNVAVIWRDGEIVYESYDDDPEDGDDYTYAYTAWEAFDFE